MIFLLLLLLIPSNVFASQVYYNKTSGEVMTIADSPVILSVEDQKVIVSSTLSDNFDIKTLSKPLTYYIYNGNSFALNTNKIAAEENDQIVAAQAAKAQADAKASAMSKLKALGLTDSEIQSILGK